MKKFKKIGAFVLAALMMLALSVTAFAETPADAIPETGIVSGDSLSSVSILVKLTNADGYAPNTTLSYALSIPDSVASPIRKGVEGGAALTTASLVYTAAEGNADKYLNVALDASRFTQPGVYRYLITQADLTAEQTEIGMTADANPVRALDVYVVWNVRGESCMITNTVLSKDPSTLTVDTDAGEYQHSAKTDNFTNVYGEGEEGLDHLVTISKAVTGSLGDTSFDFPFTVQLSYVSAFEEEADDAATTLDGMTFALRKGEGEAATSQDVTVGGEAVAFTLKNDESVTLILPKSVTVKVVEIYDNPEKYEITSSAASFEEGSMTQISRKVYEDTTGTIGRMAASDAAIAYTNNLSDISPTGVILRVAPYAMILTAGIALLLASKRSRRDEA